PMHSDPERFADVAAIAVASDQVIRAHAVVGLRCKGAKDGCDTVLILFEAHQLRRITNVRAECLGVLAQDRLDTVLSGRAHACRTPLGRSPRSARQNGAQLPAGHALSDDDAEVAGASLASLHQFSL